ncbi:hypothetical protein VTO42DRAFT_787 [Malbranchea cinnamomea]
MPLPTTDHEADCCSSDSVLTDQSYTTVDTMASPPLGPTPLHTVLRHLFTLQCEVDPPVDIGSGPYGRCRGVPIARKR